MKGAIAWMKEQEDAAEQKEETTENEQEVLERPEYAADIVEEPIEDDVDLPDDDEFEF